MRPDQLPEAVWGAIQDRIGGVIRTQATTGGFTPGVKLLLHTDDGGFYFLKSAPSDHWAGQAYAAEAAVHQWLPATASGQLLLAHLTLADHETLLFRGVPDRRPGASRWADTHEAQLALLGLERTYRDLDDAAPADLASSIDSFWGAQRFWRDCASGAIAAPADLADRELRRLAELEAGVRAVLGRPQWSAEVAHEDLRRDQFLITADGAATVIDWSFVARSPRLVDAVGLGVSFGLSGIDPELALRGPGPFGDYEEHDVDCVLATLAGYFLEAARVTEGKPTSLVAAQQAQGATCLRWLRARRAVTPGAAVPWTIGGH